MQNARANRANYSFPLLNMQIVDVLVSRRALSQLGFSTRSTPAMHHW